MTTAILCVAILCVILAGYVFILREELSRLLDAVVYGKPILPVFVDMFRHVFLLSEEPIVFKKGKLFKSSLILLVDGFTIYTIAYILWMLLVEASAVIVVPQPYNGLAVFTAYIMTFHIAVVPILLLVWCFKKSLGYIWVNKEAMEGNG